MGSFIFFLLLIVGLIAFFVVRIYNNLQAKMQDIREQFSNIQARLKKRNDLAKQIVDIAAQYDESERFTHINLSNSLNAAQSVSAISQAYPELKANQTYQTLMHQLETIEQEILEKRESYNATVNAYNSYRNAVPQVFVASKLSFDIVPYFNISDDDFSENNKFFEKDDSLKLKDAINASGKKIADTASNVKKNITEIADSALKSKDGTDGKDGAASDEDKKAEIADKS